MVVIVTNYCKLGTKSECYYSFKEKNININLNFKDVIVKRNNYKIKHRK